MGSMIGTRAQQDQFKNRLKRIAVGGENTTKHMYVGMVEEASGAPSKKKKSKKRSKPAQVLTRSEPRPNIFGELFMIPIAILAGALAVLGARVVSYRFMTEQSFYTSEFFGIPGSMLCVVGIAIVFAILARIILSLNTPSRRRAEFAGLAGMALFENLVVVQAPEVFATLYSDTYVNQVIAQFG